MTKKLKPYPGWVCYDCGIKANKDRVGKKCFDCSTIHEGKCGVCGEIKPVTEPRDFFYPKFKECKYD